MIGIEIGGKFRNNLSTVGFEARSQFSTKVLVEEIKWVSECHLSLVKWLLFFSKALNRVIKAEKVRER